MGVPCSPASFGARKNKGSNQKLPSYRFAATRRSWRSPRSSYQHRLACAAKQLSKEQKYREASDMWMEIYQLFEVGLLPASQPRCGPRFVAPRVYLRVAHVGRRRRTRSASAKPPWKTPLPASCGLKTTPGRPRSWVRRTSAVVCFLVFSSFSPHGPHTCFRIPCAEKQAKLLAETASKAFLYQVRQHTGRA